MIRAWLIAVPAILIPLAIEAVLWRGFHFLIEGISPEFGLAIVTAGAWSILALVVPNWRRLEAPRWASVLCCSVIVVVTLMMTLVTSYSLSLPSRWEAIAGLLLGSWIYPFLRWAVRYEEREKAAEELAAAHH